MIYQTSTMLRLRASMMSVVLTGLLLSYPLVGFAAVTITSNDNDNGIVIRGGISLGLKRGQETIPHLSLRDADLKDVLYSLAKMGQFNLIVDDKVDGTLTVDLNNVSIEKSFEYILTVGDLSYTKDGSTIIVTTREDASDKSLNKMVLKSLPVRYSNAQDLVGVLNSTVFNVNRPGGNNSAVATADPRTNSILIMGNQSDVELAQRALVELDFPLQHKTFLLKNAPAQDVATAIAQTLFGVTLMSGAGGAGGINGNNNQNNANGNGANNNAQVNGGANVAAAGGAVAGGAAAGGAATGGAQVGGAAGGTAGGADGDTLSTGRGVQVSKGGSMTFITNPANNTMTLLGTAEQIALAENLIYDLDIRPPQVAIEVTIIQLTENKNKTFDMGIDANTGINVLLGNFGITNVSSAASIFWNKGIPSNSNLLSQLQANSLFSVANGRILARPTLVAVSGTSSTVNLTSEVFGGFTTTIVPGGATSNVTRTPIIKEVGLTLNITPRITNNGTVNLSIQPNLSAPSGTISVDEGNGVTNDLTLLSTTSMQVANARVQDGETLILGGLVQETDTSGVGNKIPLLGDIPLIGTLFRNGNSNRRARTELMVLVTPHLIREEGVPYFRNEWKDRAAYHSLTYGSSGTSPVRGPQQGYSQSSAPTNQGSGYARPDNSSYIGTQQPQQQDYLPNYNQVLK